MRFLLSLLMLATLLLAEHDEHHERHMPLDISYLDLTQEQHEKVERIVRSHQEAHRRHKRHKRESRELIGRLFTAEKFDSERFLEVSAQLRDEAATMQAEFLGAIHDVLTPEQRRHFANYMQEWEIE
jgi:Spy/CpxP family protein refolding chaperone